MAAAPIRECVNCKEVTRCPAFGLCWRCYNLRRKGQDLGLPRRRARHKKQRLTHENGELVAVSCNRCDRDLPLTEFSPNRYRVIGIQSVCRECRRHEARVNRGMTSDGAATPLASACEICGATFSLVLDHDHETGEVRGTLCRRCNLGIGYFRDDVNTINAALRYIGDDVA